MEKIKLPESYSEYVKLSLKGGGLLRAIEYNSPDERVQWIKNNFKWLIDSGLITMITQSDGHNCVAFNDRSVGENKIYLSYGIFQELKDMLHSFSCRIKVKNE